MYLVEPHSCVRAAVLNRWSFDGVLIPLAGWRYDAIMVLWWSIQRILALDVRGSFDSRCVTNTPISDLRHADAVKSTEYHQDMKGQRKWGHYWRA